MKKTFDLSAAALHILAMTFMLMDHLWATLLSSQMWLTHVGRLAFPIFAFLAVEGYFHTRSFKRYALRMLLFAVLSEVPFDLMYGGTVFYPVHQNVIWTLLLGLLGIRLMEAARAKGKRWLYVLTCAAVVVLGFALGTLGMVDYYGAGVLTVFAFYFSASGSGGVCSGSLRRCTGSTWWCSAGRCIRSRSSDVRSSCASRGLRCLPSCRSGSTAGGRDTTARRSSMPAMRFTPRICWCWPCLQ